MHANWPVEPGSPLWRARANSDGVWSPSAVHPNETIYSCQSCHDGLVDAVADREFHETRWATPPAAMDIDWGQIIDDAGADWGRAVCERIVAQLPTSDARRDHFHEDGRLFWATESGLTPFGSFLPTATPNDFDVFLQRFDVWNDAGAPCPE